MDFSKLRQSSQSGDEDPPPHLPPGKLVAGIVTVKKEGYVPPRVQLRKTMGPLIFTADFLTDDLPAIQQDPLVHDVEVTRLLPVIKAPEDDEIEEAED